MFIIQGEFRVTILIRLKLYTIYIAPIVSPSQPHPNPLKAIARGFLVLFHIGIWSPLTIYLHLNLLPSLSPPPTHTHYAYFTVLVLINIWVNIQRGVSMYARIFFFKEWNVVLKLRWIQVIVPSWLINVALTVWREVQDCEGPLACIYSVLKINSFKGLVFCASKSRRLTCALNTW
jgi:hypothetical protein